jgi:hypothetical protein
MPPAPSGDIRSPQSARFDDRVEQLVLIYLAAGVVVSGAFFVAAIWKLISFRAYAFDAAIRGM